MACSIDSLPVGTKEKVYADLTSSTDLTTGTVEFAFVSTKATPTSGWTAGTWPVGGTNTALSAVWDTTALSQGVWYVYVRVTISGQTIIRNPGEVRLI